MTFSLEHACCEWCDSKDNLIQGTTHDGKKLLTCKPRHTGFRGFEYDFHDGLKDLGLRSAHRRPQPHSWIGRSGAGYLYDYVHLGPGVACGECEYLHEPRALGLSDHAAVAAVVAPLATPPIQFAEGVFA